MEPDWRGRIALRSRLTGRLLRMVGNRHPGFHGWVGVSEPFAQAKTQNRSGEDRRQAARSFAPNAQCPLGGASERAHRLPPPPRGWSFNASAYAAHVRRSLAYAPRGSTTRTPHACTPIGPWEPPPPTPLSPRCRRRPWYDGGLSATAVDLAYWREMFPYENRYERPTLHVSIQANALLYKWQPPPDAQAAGPAAAAGGSRPPIGSAEHTLLRMLLAVTQACPVTQPLRSRYAGVPRTFAAYGPPARPWPCW